MDFSVILVVPWAAILAFGTVVVTAIMRRPKTRLVWPFALAVTTSMPVFVGLPTRGEFHFWALATFGLAVWAATGTVMGALIGRFMVWAAHTSRSG